MIVVGGGLAGWVAAATAARGGATVTVLDRDGIGGRAATDRVDGYLLNRGAHALYTGGPGMRVLTDLGVRAPGRTPSNRHAKARIGDRLEPLPLGPGSLLRTRLLGGRAKATLLARLASLMRRDPASAASLTIDDLLDDLELGDDARQVLAALIRVVSYVADHGRVSADVALTQLQLGARGVRYLHGGWGRLVDELRGVARARGVRVVRAVATSVASDGGLVEVTTAETRWLASHVVLATGSAASAADLLGRTPPEWQVLGPAAEASCLDVALDTPTAPPLTIGIDEPLYFNSHEVAELAPRGGSVAHVMRYLRADEEWPATEGRARLEDHLRVVGVAPGSVRHTRYLHRMTVTSALPVPERGGMAGRPDCTSTGDERITVAGDWVGPTGNLADVSLVSGADAGRTAATRALRAVAR